MCDKPKYDLGFLNKISGGDKAFIVDMLTTFKEMAPEFISNTKRYIEESNLEGVSREAHRFLPGVSFLGIKDLEEELAKLEEYSKKNINTEQIPELVNKSIEKVNDIIAIFNQEFDLE